MTSTDDSRDSRYAIPSVIRALDVLEVLGASASDLGISDIATQLDIPKNSVFRITATLEQRGYLSRDKTTKRYRLSPRLLRLGYAAVDDNSLLEKALPILRDLRDATGETVLLGAISGSSGGVVLEEIPSKHPVKVLVNVGTPFPLHTAAPAKAILAHLPEEERLRLLAACRFERFNDRTLVRQPELLAELEMVRKLGYSVDRGEEVEGVTCVGAVVMNYQGRPVAGMWITGPESRMGELHFERVGPIVAEHALRLSERLGYAKPLNLADSA